MTDENAIVVRPEQSIAITEGPGALLHAIVALAKDPAVDVTKLSALMAMQERMETRQAEIEFDRALARISEIMPRVKKNGRINLIKKDGSDGGSYAFAKWEDMDAILRPLMGREGFTLSFDAVPRPGEGGGLIVTGRLLHRDGHSRSASMPLALDTGPGRNNLQAMGSTLSYGKRYCAEMLLNIIREGDDDDGKRGGMVYIDAAQAEELGALLVATKTDEARFLEQMTSEARSLTEVEERDFVRLKNLLLAKQKAMTKGAKS